MKECVVADWFICTAKNFICSRHFGRLPFGLRNCYTRGSLRNMCHKLIYLHNKRSINTWTPCCSGQAGAWSSNTPAWPEKFNRQIEICKRLVGYWRFFLFGHLLRFLSCSIIMALLSPRTKSVCETGNRVVRLGYMRTPFKVIFQSIQISIQFRLKGKCCIIDITIIYCKVVYQ